MKEGAARAVLREVWLQGQRCVELQRDGRRTIFFCTRCSTRCYSDAALVDHLQGSLHFRLSAALLSDKNSGSRRNGERAILARDNDDGLCNQVDRSRVCRGGMQGETQIILAGALGAAGPSKTSLEWIGSGELFFSVRSACAPPVVDSSWFNWKGKCRKGPELGWQYGWGSGIVCAVVTFPYSDMIGRGGDWSVESKQTRTLGVQAEDRLFVALPATIPQTSCPKVNTRATVGNQAFATRRDNSSTSVETVFDKNNRTGEPEKQKHVVLKESSGRILRHPRKRKKAKVVERLCFICHQRMASGKDVAALLNLQTKQMVCGSRNKRGMFHVYHSSCLIDWISICELKTFTGQVAHRIDHSKKLTRTKCDVVEQSVNPAVQEDSGSLSNVCDDGAIFCPECQGTGLNLRGAQLEHPRYRLAQVFDWILELIQARKAWTDNRNKEDASRCGLLFRDELQGAVQSRGLVHYYAGCADALTRNSVVR